MTKKDHHRKEHRNGSESSIKEAVRAGGIVNSAVGIGNAVAGAVGGLGGLGPSALRGRPAQSKTPTRSVSFPCYATPTVVP